jgi:hypothetical protein
LFNGLQGELFTQRVRLPSISLPSISKTKPPPITIDPHMPIRSQYSEKQNLPFAQTSRITIEKMFFYQGTQ